MGSGWIALYQFMKAKEQEPKDRREQWEKRLSKHRAGGQKLRCIKLTEEEKRTLRAKILEQQRRWKDMISWTTRKDGHF